MQSPAEQPLCGSLLSACSTGSQSSHSKAGFVSVLLILAKHLNVSSSLPSVEPRWLHLHHTTAADLAHLRSQHSVFFRSRVLESTRCYSYGRCASVWSQAEKQSTIEDNGAFLTLLSFNIFHFEHSHVHVSFLSPAFPLLLFEASPRNSLFWLEQRERDLTSLWPTIPDSLCQESSHPRKHWKALLVPLLSGK